MELAGRVAVITGASRGLGAGLADAFAAHGIRLGLCARSRPERPDGTEVVAESVDVTDADGMQAFTERVVATLGPIDLWINNAGVLEPIAPLRDVAPDAFRAHLDVNLTGVFVGSRCFVRHLRARGGAGVLINVSSGAARKPYHGWSAYCAGKAGVDRLTECLDLEERDSGLRAYAVAPGVVDTDMQALIRATPPERFPARPRFVARKEHGVFNSTRHVADAFLRIAFDPTARPDAVCVTVADEVGSAALPD